MCGIIYGESFTDKPINGFIMNQFEAQKTRGQQGFGVFDKECGRLVRNPQQGSIMRWLENHPAKTLLFHHRLPTSTDNVKNACHPFSTQDKFDTNYILVHNGHIGNSRTLKSAHEKLGIEYYSTQKDGRFNDSEALLWDVALYLEGEQDELKAYGGIAFICMAIPKDKRKSTKLYFARNSNPLNLSFDTEALLLSSEGKGEPIPANTLHEYNYRTKQLKSMEFEISGYTPYVSGKWNNKQSTYRGTVTHPVTTPKNSYWDDDEDFSSFTEYDSYEAWQTAQTKKKADSLIGDPKTEDDKGMLQELLDGVELDGLMILPADADYSYQSVMVDFDDDVIMDDNLGQTQNIKQVIFDRMDTYLETADGNYKDAYTLLNSDLIALKQALKNDDAKGMTADGDVVLEIDILLCTKYTMYTSRYWTSTWSIDPWYINDQPSTLKDGIKTFLSRNKQSSLTLGDGKK